MQISKNKVVQISYQLRTEENGTVVDEATAEAPLTYLAGFKNLLDKFETELDGKVAGNDFSFVLSPSEGYGEYNADQLVQLDINMFANEQGVIQYEWLALGSTIPLRDNDGNTFRATIKEVDNEHVLVDLNHTMAGKTLYFSGTVISVRDASAEELEHGHVHGPGGHHH